MKGGKAARDDLDAAWVAWVRAESATPYSYARALAAAGALRAALDEAWGGEPRWTAAGRREFLAFERGTRRAAAARGACAPAADGVPTEFRCPGCGGSTVQIARWEEINTGREIDDPGIDLGLYCPACGEGIETICRVAMLTGYCQEHDEAAGSACVPEPRDESGGAP